MEVLDPTVFDLELSPAQCGSVKDLREHLIMHLANNRPAVGSSLPSLTDFAEKTGASISTVRRALQGLESEGWIERRTGKGTFVGPRAALPFNGYSNPESNGRSFYNSSDSLSQHYEMMTMGVVITSMGDQRGDWYSRSVLAGIDAEAASRLVRVEIFGSQSNNPRVFSRRLMASRPDVLTCVLMGLRDLSVVSEAKRLDIPVVGAGYRMAEFGVPSVLQDDIGGAKAAVQYLIEYGHRRIGFVQMAVSRRYAHLRRIGYEQGIKEAGIEIDPRLELWLPARDPREGDNHSALVPTWTEHLQDFLCREQPSALILGNGMIIEALAPLIRKGKINIPEQLSLITFDQTHDIYKNILDGINPTVIALPWEEFGRRMVRMAHTIFMGETLENSAPELSCHLIPGDTVSPVYFSNPG